MVFLPVFLVEGDALLQLLLTQDGEGLLLRQANHHLPVNKTASIRVHSVLLKLLYSPFKGTVA